MVFTISPLVEEARTPKGWLATVLSYALGIALVMVLIGGVVGLAGGAITEALSTVTGRLTVSGIVYSAVGIFASAYGLKEFGLLPLPNLWPYLPLPERLLGRGGYQRSFLLGTVVGGGFGLGCPFPTYQALLVWIAAVGNPIYGAVLLGANALGRATPIFVTGLLIFAGVSPQRITRWLTERRNAVAMVNGIALTLLGVFLIVYWGLLVPSRVLW